MHVLGTVHQQRGPVDAVLLAGFQHAGLAVERCAKANPILAFPFGQGEFPALAIGSSHPGFRIGQ
jgi:hypothetical protein